jgi:uncharacterized membrane protein YidH (DUF202 family)
MSIVSIIILIVFVGILLSLGSALFYLGHDKGDSKRTVRALTIRISLSIALFLLLMILIGLGVIQPHGLYPPQAS